MIAALSIGLAGYELFAFATHGRLITSARGWMRLGVGAWWLVLGAHLAYEWIATDIGRATAEAF